MAIFNSKLLVYQRVEPTANWSTKIDMFGERILRMVKNSNSPPFPSPRNWKTLQRSQHARILGAVNDDHSAQLKTKMRWNIVRHIEVFLNHLSHRLCTLYPIDLIFHIHPSYFDLIFQNLNIGQPRHNNARDCSPAASSQIILSNGSGLWPCFVIPFLNMIRKP